MRTIILALLVCGAVFGQCGASGTLIFNPISGLMDCTGSSSASGTVTSVGLAGTANQITVTGATPITGSGSWTLSFPTTVAIPATGSLGGVTLSGLTGPIYMTAGVPRIATGTCNSSNAVFGDGTCAAISTAFSILTSATNSQAAMVVGTGASLAVSGTGTIAATTVTGFSPAAAKVLTLSNSMTTTATDGSTVAFGTGGSPLYIAPFMNGNDLGNQVGAGLTSYLFGLNASGTLSIRNVVSSVTGHLANLCVQTLTTQSANNSMICSAYVNGSVASALTTTFTAGQTATTQCDTTHQVAVAPTDTVAVGCLNNANVNGAQIGAWGMAIAQ